MKPFINKTNYNKINKHMQNFLRVLKYNSDPQTTETAREIIEEDILEMFRTSGTETLKHGIMKIDEEEIHLLDISKLNKPEDIKPYLKALDEYTYGHDTVSEAALKKLFRKEKKLSIPTIDWDKKPVYIRWYDVSSKKLYIAYQIDNQLLGMVCRLQHANPATNTVCKLCNQPGKGDEIGFVSTVCKSTQYKSLGFSVCLDGDKCNERISDTKNLEGIITKANTR